jgi:hypothetical protein
MRETSRRDHAARPGADAGDSRPVRRRGPEGRRLVRRAGLASIVGLLAWGLFATDMGGIGQLAAEPAPDVTVSTANGEFRLSHQRGKVLVLYFSFPG